MKAIVLLSVARHPLSGKILCSPNDLRALCMMQDLGKELSLEISAVHAGDAGCPALSTYLGYGLDTLQVLSVSKKTDPVPVLIDYLRQEKPDIIVTGMYAHSGEGAGMVPYSICAQLEYPLFSGVMEIRKEDGALACMQYLPKGKRRELKIKPPTLISVHPRTDLTHQYVWAQEKRGTLERISAPNPNPGRASPTKEIAWEYGPAERQRKRLSIASDRTGFERMQRAISLDSGSGQANVITEGDAKNKAQKVYNFLKEKNIL